MKTALYIEDGVEQIVLTPENDTEKMALAKLEDASRSIEIKRGSFYACQGGWVRHQQALVTAATRGEDMSTMIVLRRKEGT